MLNEQQAVAIYMIKISLGAQNRTNNPNTNTEMQVIKGQSVRVSVMYGVNARTIRDIWNRQSWAYATRHLWYLEPQPRVANALSMSTVKVLLHPY